MSMNLDVPLKLVEELSSIIAVALAGEGVTFAGTPWQLPSHGNPPPISFSRFSAETRSVYNDRKRPLEDSKVYHLPIML